MTRATPLRIPDEANAETRALLEFINGRDAKPMIEIIPAEARADYRERAKRGNFAAVDVGGVEDRILDGPGGGLPLRIYRPAEDAGGETATRPVLLYTHGGGFVIGDLETHDPICRRICADAGAVVCALDYRLAPEAPYPAAVEDTLAALRWLFANLADLGGGTESVWLAGDSAGGTLAAVAAQEARDNDMGTIAGQILIYPSVDQDDKYPSRHSLRDVFPITAPVIDWFADHTFGAERPRLEPWASPARALSLRGLPPTLVLTAGLDPLVDEGAAYARALGAAGVAVRYRCFEGTVHGFLALGNFVSDADRAIGEIVDFMGQNA